MRLISAARQPATELKIHEVAAGRNSFSHWFAAYTSSHHEKRVASHLASRQIESFLPLYATLHRWKNRCKMNLELPLFPNYVFVRIDPPQRVRVLEVPGVLSLVGFGGVLAPLPDFEIEALRAGVGLRKIAPHPYLAMGERVRIKAGPLRGMEGVLVRKKNSFRVVLSLDVIFQSVAVEVDADDLESAVANVSLPVVLPPEFAAGPIQRLEPLVSL